MDGFTLSARPIHKDGSRGALLAQVSADSAEKCLTAMAAEVEAWLPSGRYPRSGQAPRELELRLTWHGEAGSPPATPGAPCPMAGSEGHTAPAKVPGRVCRRRAECRALPIGARPALRPPLAASPAAALHSARGPGGS